jgi:transposase
MPRRWVAPHGEKSAVLRREGLFHSHVREWAATRDAGALAGLDRDGSTSDRRQRRAHQAEIDRSRAENQRLTGKLAQTQVLSVVAPADVAVTENADGFCGLVGTVTPIVAK